MKENSPTSAYQCVSRPGSCKFEWCCGPLTQCHVMRQRAGTAEEKRDIKNAQNRQYRWRKKEGLA